MDVFKVLVDPKAFSAVKLPWGSTRRERDISERYRPTCGPRWRICDELDDEHWGADRWGFGEDWGCL